MTIILPVTTEARFRLVAIFTWAAPAWKRRCWEAFLPSAACSTAARGLEALALDWHPAQRRLFYGGAAHHNGPQ